MTMNVQQQRLAGGVLLVIFLAWLIHSLAPILLPFITAWVLAYALAPWAKRLTQWGKGLLPHALSALLVELGFFCLLVCLFALLTPIFSQEVPALKAQLPKLLESLQATLAPLALSLGWEVSLDAQGLKDMLLKALDASWNEWSSQLVVSLKIGGSAALAVIGNVILTPLLLFYFLLDQDLILTRILAWVPPRFRATVERFTSEVDHLLGQYLRGQLGVMLAMALYYSCMLKLLGLGLALPIGVFTGLVICIPYVGFCLGLCLATLAALLQFEASHAFTLVLVVFGLGQVLEGFFLTPKWVGERIGLHPVAVIFALLVGGQWFGFFGVMVALPSSAVISVALRWLQDAYWESNFFRDEAIEPKSSGHSEP